MTISTEAGRLPVLVATFLEQASRRWRLAQWVVSRRCRWLLPFYIWRSSLRP